MAQSLEVGYSSSFIRDAYTTLHHAPDTSVSDRTPRKVKQRSKLTDATNILGLATIALGSYGCAVGPAGFVEAANIPPNPIVTLTGMADSATGVAETPTPQEGVQEPTFVDVPFLLPTDIVPSLTPVTPEASPTIPMTPIATEIQPSVTQESITPTVVATQNQATPTEGETKVEQEDWIDEYFLKEIPKGAIDLGKIPLKAQRGLEISGPNIASYQLSYCKIQENIEKLQAKKMYLSSLDMDFNRPEGDLRYCVIGMSTEESLGRWTKEIFPSQTPEEQKKLVDKEIRMFTALMNKIQSMDNRYVDAYLGIVPGPIKENTDVAIFFYGNPSPSTGNYPIIEILDLQGSQLVPLQH